MKNRTIQMEGAVVTFAPETGVIHIITENGPLVKVYPFSDRVIVEAYITTMETTTESLSNHDNILIR